MAIASQYPYVDEQGQEDNTLIKFYSDESKSLIKLETGEEYEEAIDLYPSKFHYIEKDIEASEEGNDYGRTELAN